MKLDKVYSPGSFEKRIYDGWIEGGYFEAVPNKDKKAFSIVIPPPNVTGQLHIGHAFNLTLQDILIRFKRMTGFEALWLPGTDHAGIATQIKVEETLRKNEGITRYDLGREKFLERVWVWKKEYGDTIINQAKRLGCSCDWERERFTMDEGCSRAVRKVFIDLYEKGLIYQGNRIINWCPSCITALSDAEVEYEEREGSFWYIKYPVKENGDYVVIATTRPETMLGDTAVAVNPLDERYKHLVGKTLILPLLNREIPVIADEYVDKDFGTGAVKITPAHDPNDFEVGRRHNLPQIKVMDDNAVINEHGGVYQGMSRYDARKKIIADLQELNLLVKTEAHKHNVGQCYRCATVVEPIISKQWFVKMKPLAEDAIKVVKDGTIEFIPERFSKIYLNWMENVHDWCISRQLWWGHRIPAFYCGDCGGTTVSQTDINVCPKCGGELTQDPDVLDTWFSSALWPFSTMGWPEKTDVLEYFYPTSVLVTAYDIIFFWVARMIFSGLEHMGKIPFGKVFIHGLVRDEQGRKMSKSLGNGIDPLEIFDKYGADALRFSLVNGNSPGNDIRVSEDKIEAGRNFANKLWNASRFVLMNLTIDKCELPEKLNLEDMWILDRLNFVAGEVRENIDKYEIGIALAKIYSFIWDDFCDWYIELCKPRLYDGSDNEGTQNVLCYVLSQALTLLHPFMPFITEEIWQSLPCEGNSIMECEYPGFLPSLVYKEEERQMKLIMNAVREIRNTRANMNVPASKHADIIIITKEVELFNESAVFFQKLASADGVTVCDNESGVVGGDMAIIITEGAKIFIPVGELIDHEAELARLQKEKSRIESEIHRVNEKLNNEKFTQKAPARLVEEERGKSVKYKKMLDEVNEGIKKINI